MPVLSGPLGGRSRRCDVLPVGRPGELAESAEAIEMHIEVNRLPFIAAGRRHDVHPAGMVVQLANECQATTVRGPAREYVHRRIGRDPPHCGRTDQRHIDINVSRLLVTLPGERHVSTIW